jgi:hypothetical protein
MRSLALKPGQWLILLDARLKRKWFKLTKLAVFVNRYSTVRTSSVSFVPRSQPVAQGCPLRRESILGSKDEGRWAGDLNI